MRLTANNISLAVCCLLLVFIVLAWAFRTETEVTEKHLVDAIALIDNSSPYYSPALNSTVNWSERPFQQDKVSYFGVPMNMVIASDITRTVIGIINGKIGWLRKYPEIWPRAMDIYNGHLYIGNRHGVDIIDLDSGNLDRQLALRDLPALTLMNSLRITVLNDVPWLIVALDSPLIDGVVAPTTHGIQQYLLHKDREPELAGKGGDSVESSNPRDALFVNGVIYIADTHAHRVVSLHKTTEKMNVTSVYFPNTVDYLKSDSSTNLIVAAEHENRVFSLDLKTGEKRLLMYCPHPPFNDPILDGDRIARLQSSTVATGTGDSPPKSLCATEHSGLWTLYSPNSARVHNDRIIITDTDNHMVKVIDGKRMLALVAGIPNPVNALLF